jgi:hypothetical protein
MDKKTGSKLAYKVLLNSLVTEKATIMKAKINIAFL